MLTAILWTTVLLQEL